MKIHLQQNNNGLTLHQELKMKIKTYLHNTVNATMAYQGQKNLTFRA